MSMSAMSMSTSMSPMAPVVVGVDGTPDALDAVDLAAEEAAARLTPLVVLHAAPPPHEPCDALAVATTRALAEHPGLAVSGTVVATDPARLLIDWSRRAYLVVLGHERTGAGPVTTRVVYEAACPVLVQRPLDGDHHARAPRPVLVGIGGHPSAESVVAFAFEQAALRGTALWAMRVRTPDEDGPDGPLEDLLAVWSGKYPEVPLRRLVRYGPMVVPALLNAAREAQLLVVGASRRGAPSQRVRGLVTHAVLDLAACPVAAVPLTYRTDTTTRGWDETG